jgi:hypothetical protein
MRKFGFWDLATLCEKLSTILARIADTFLRESEVEGGYNQVCRSHIRWNCLQPAYMQHIFPYIFLKVTPLEHFFTSHYVLHPIWSSSGV